MSINIRDCHERKESKVDKRVYFLYERLDICQIDICLLSVNMFLIWNLKYMHFSKIRKIASQLGFLLLFALILFVG